MCGTMTLFFLTLATFFLFKLIRFLFLHLLLLLLVVSLFGFSCHDASHSFVCSFVTNLVTISVMLKPTISRYKRSIFGDTNLYTIQFPN